MAVNLAKNYSGKLAEYFRQSSLLKGRTGGRYDFTGVKSLKVYSLQPAQMTNYSRSGTSRYGNPTDVQDTVQEMIMSRDRSFTAIIDKGDHSQSMMVRNAMEWLRMEMDTVATPDADIYAFGKFVTDAGQIYGVSNAPTKSTIVEILGTAMSKLDDKHVPSTGRTIFITATMYNLLRQSTEFAAGASSKLAERSLEKGVVGEFMGADVVKVPTDYLPTNCYFLIAWKNALLYPWQINDTNVHQDPPGVSGHLIEGRFIYDAFVVGSVADGVLACVLAASKQATPTVTKGETTTTIASSSATSIKYTTDGTDPRYSDTAQTYSSAITNPTAGTVIKAVAYGTFTSDVKTHTCV